MNENEAKELIHEQLRETPHKTPVRDALEMRLAERNKEAEGIAFCLAMMDEHPVIEEFLAAAQKRGLL